MIKGKVRTQLTRYCISNCLACTKNCLLPFTAKNKLLLVKLFVLPENTANTSFQAKWRLRNEHINSILIRQKSWIANARCLISLLRTIIGQLSTRQRIQKSFKLHFSRDFSQNTSTSETPAVQETQPCMPSACRELAPCEVPGNPAIRILESEIHSVESRIQESLGLPYMGVQKHKLINSVLVSNNNEYFLDS